MATTHDITVNVFPGGFNWPLFVAREKGFFARNDLRVALQDTPNSVAQMTGLSAGRFEIAMTAIDNIVAYVEGQGEAPIGPQPEFRAVMGSDSGFLSLVARPGIATIADLAGKTVSVDAMTTGYAFVLFEILREAGLELGSYKIERAGGMVQRWTALAAGAQDATLLSAPYNILAKAQGFSELAPAVKVIGAYQGNVAAVRRSWAAAHRDQVAGFIRSYKTAVDWLYDVKNRAEALAILMKNVPQISPALAAPTYALLLDPITGFCRDGAIDRSGVQKVLELRSRYSATKALLTEPARYSDLSFFQETSGG